MLDGVSGHRRLPVVTSYPTHTIEPATCIEIGHEPRGQRWGGRATAHRCREIRFARAHQEAVTLELREAAADAQAGDGPSEVQAVPCRAAIQDRTPLDEQGIDLAKARRPLP